MVLPPVLQSRLQHLHYDNGRRVSQLSHRGLVKRYIHMLSEMIQGHELENIRGDLILILQHTCTEEFF